MITGFVPSYELNSGIGRKIAELKGMRKGWNYPTFLLYYLRNPGPLLLFDEVVVDDGAARHATAIVSKSAKKLTGYEGSLIKTLKPTKLESEVLCQLLESRIFRKKNVADNITEEDFERIKRGYNEDMFISRKEFRNSIAVMEKRYGRNYALPDPARFEAMNINVTGVLLEKLSAVPLDDILRSPLYAYKAIQTASAAVEETKTAYDVVEQARQVLYLPTEPLHDVDAFLDLHQDPRIRKFREKVKVLSRKRVTPQEISHEIYNANLELMKLDIQNFSIVIGFFGLVGGLTSLLRGDFASGSIGTATGLVSIGRELLKPIKMERFGWLEIVQGLCQV